MQASDIRSGAPLTIAGLIAKKKQELIRYTKFPTATKTSGKIKKRRNKRVLNLI